MLEAPLFTAAGARAKSGFALPADYFDGTVNEPVLHQAIKTFLGNQRQGNAATKTRAFISGGNEKPWRQKGTGRARQGSIRAPHWRGGGTVFGPSPRDYRTDIPIKVRRLARRSALNARAREGALFVVESLGFEAPGTKAFSALLGKLGLDGRKVLVLTHGLNRNAYLSGRNLPAAQVMPFGDAAAYHVLWSDVVVVEQGALGGEGSPEAADAEAAKPRKAAKKAAKPARTAKAKVAKKPAAGRPASRKPAARKKKEAE